MVTEGKKEEAAAPAVEDTGDVDDLVSVTAILIFQIFDSCDLNCRFTTYLMVSSGLLRHLLE